MTEKWVMFPTGRWSTTMIGHAGHLALHAWIGGEWAVTRGNSAITAGEPFVIGSREEGQPKGRNLKHAMELAQAAAQRVCDAEHVDPDRVKYYPKEAVQTSLDL